MPHQKPSRTWKSILLSILAALSLFFWLSSAILGIWSCWHTETIAYRSQADVVGVTLSIGTFELWSSFNTLENDPFSETELQWDSIQRDSKTQKMLDRMEEEFGHKVLSNDFRLLGFRVAVGKSKMEEGTLWDGTPYVRRTRWIVAIPVWFLLVAFAILPGVWVWRYRLWPSGIRRRAVWAVVWTGLTPILLGVAILALFTINMTCLGFGEQPQHGFTDHAPQKPTAGNNVIELKIMAYNIHSGHSLKLGEFIKEQNPDIVFLQEVALQAGWYRSDQAKRLAEVSGMYMWVVGEDFNLGLPFYRRRIGNGILSRWPLEIVANQSLVKDAPLYRSLAVARQRTLWCKTQLGQQDIMLASIHLGSSRSLHKPDTRSKQMQQILDFQGDRSAILAGDFNSRTGEPAFQLAMESGAFQTESVCEQPVNLRKKTKPFSSRIDFIFVPKEWELVEHQIIESDLSDHPAVLSTYRIPMD